MIFGLTESSAVGCQNEVARQRQLASAAERGPFHQRDGDEIELREDSEALMELLEHHDHAIAEVVLHARAGGEGFFAGRRDDQTVTITRYAA